MKFPKNNIIDTLLTKNDSPETTRLVAKNHAIAHKIQVLLLERKLKPVDLARLLNKNSSEISLWLTGKHTFTTRTITRIETVLNTDIIHIDTQKENIYHTVLTKHHDEDEEIDFEDSQVYSNLEIDKKKY